MPRFSDPAKGHKVLYSHLAFLLLYNSLTFCLCFWLMTVKTRAIDFRTPLL